MISLLFFVIASLSLMQPDENSPGAPTSLAVDGSEATAVAEPLPDSDLSAETDSLLIKLNRGTVTSDGLSVVFWRDQFRIAMADTVDGIFDPDILRALLLVVQKQGLPEPFRFTAGSELTEAESILAASGEDLLTKLRRELLATELNLASGRAWVASRDQMRRLNLRAESLINAAEAALEVAEGEAPGEIDSELEADMRRVVEVFGAINTGGGGGVDE
jgi:hypothetical protein